jgi:hypothetical protein
VQNANSPRAVREAIAEMTRVLPKPGQKPVQPAPVPAPEPAAVEATPAVEPEAASEVTSEATPGAEGGEEQTTQAPEEGADTETDEDGGEGPVTPLTGKRAHLRVPDSEVDRLALAYQRRNRDWSLAQSLEAAQKHLGITPQTPPADAPKTETPAQPSLPATPQATQEAITKALADYKKAMSEVRFEDAADLQAKIFELTAHRSTLERSAEQQEAQKAKQYDAEFDASNAKAVDLYPFAADSASPGFKRMAQIDAQLKANDDPLYYAANKPLKLAQMAAAELSIAPRNKNAQPAKPAAAQAPAGVQPKKGVVPSGSSRTTPPATNQPTVDPAITSIKSVRDLREQYKRLGIPM